MFVIQSFTISVRLENGLNLIVCIHRSAMTTVIKAINLRKTFDELTAVAGINFSIEEGECFGFLGPNGAGKSTTCA
jgi:ABC-2 type transport system ATP-binding protein